MRLKTNATAACSLQACNLRPGSTGNAYPTPQLRIQVADTNCGLRPSQRIGGKGQRPRHVKNLFSMPHKALDVTWNMRSTDGAGCQFVAPTCTAAVWLRDCTCALATCFSEKPCYPRQRELLTSILPTPCVKRRRTTKSFTCRRSAWHRTIKARSGTVRLQPERVSRSVTAKTLTNQRNANTRIRQRTVGILHDSWAWPGASKQPTGTRCPLHKRALTDSLNIARTCPVSLGPLARGTRSPCLRCGAQDKCTH